MNSHEPDIAIIGAGVAGLACGRRLFEAGKKFVIYEASDGIGGRLRTDEVEGFRLDRGFQVFLPALPMAKAMLNYDALDLRKFYRGAQVCWAGKRHRLADPLYHPTDAFRSLRDPVVSWKDKWLMLLLRKHLFSLRELPRDTPEIATIDYLRDWGFSDVFINHFLRPFFGGVFTDRELMASSRLFEFLFAMCDRGGTAIPALGIQAVPQELAKGLPVESIKLNHRVVSVAPGEVTFEDGRKVRADHIIMATSEADASRLVPVIVNPKSPLMRATTCLYFTTANPPPPERILYIDGDLHGPVNHACVVSNLAPERAPAGEHLISASVLGAPSSSDLSEVVIEQMRLWFGDDVDQWRHLRTYQILNAQSLTRQLHVGDGSLPAKVADGLYRCGDYCEDVSLNGMLTSGCKAASACLDALA
jgi:phytoene dehydrogenase-like protein